MLLFLTGAGGFAGAQGFIGKPLHKVQKELEQHLAKNRLQGRLYRENETLALQLEDPKFRQARFTYAFREGRCIEERIIACDTCVLKYFHDNLAKKAYGWEALNDSTYVSKFGRHLRMSRQLGAQPMLLIQRIHWSRREYEARLRSR